MRVAAFALCGALMAGAAPASAGQFMPDPPYQPATAAANYNEVRIGASFSAFGPSPARQSGAFIEGEVLLASPFPAHGSAWLDALLRPRPDLGVTVSTTGAASQIYAGLTWDFPLVGALYLDASAGGALHNGPLDQPPGVRGPRLGSRALFHLGLGLGYSFNAHWNALVTVEHSSNAGLAKHNDGINLVAAMVGYRF
jgi:hypothetical protein